MKELGENNGKKHFVFLNRLPWQSFYVISNRCFYEPRRSPLSITISLKNHRNRRIIMKFMTRLFLLAALTSIAAPKPAIAESAFPPSTSTPMIIATAYTDLTLPTLQRGDRGESVQLLQQILSDNGFLNAAGVRLGNPSGAVVDGVFGSITESAVRDLQQRYDLSVTGQVNPTTWEVLDMEENPYRSTLPWKQ
jgi:Putative peptidoglycan binding domain